MNRKFRFGVLFVSLILSLAFTVPAMAAPPMALHIEVPATISPDPDPFTATGPAVDAGTVCPSGDSTDLSVVVVSDPPGGTTTRTLRVMKRFDCTDGSGTFDVNMVVRLDLTTNETTARWRIVGGTGDYAGFRGNGYLIGTPIMPGSSIYDVYDGWVH